MMPYLAPSQISSIEERLTGKNHSAMYFAGNAVATSIIGAVSGGLVYEYIKNVFLVRGKGLVWAEAGNGLSASEVAYKSLFKVEGGAVEVAENVFNLGNLIVPFIVVISCVLGFFVAFKLPRDFSSLILAKEFKKMDPTLDISEFEVEEKKAEDGEIIFVSVGLSILSGFIFGFIWLGLLMKSVKRLGSRIKALVPYLVSVLIPFASIYTSLKIRGAILDAAKTRGADVKMSKTAIIVSSIFLPILPINVVALSILQSGVNKLVATEEI